MPHSQLATCLVEHPIAQRDDKAGFFSNRNELVREDHASLGMVPAKQCLKTNKLAICDELWLILQMKFAIFQCMAQIAHQFQALAKMRIDFLSEHLKAILAAEFGMIHGSVRILLQ